MILLAAMNSLIPALGHEKQQAELAERIYSKFYQ